MTDKRAMADVARDAKLGYLGRTMAQRRAGRTVKISVSLDRDDVAALRRRAKEAHGGNLSAAFSEAVRRLRQQQARAEVIEMLGGSTLTPEIMAAIDAEWAGGPPYDPKDYEPGKPKRERASKKGTRS